MGVIFIMDETPQPGQNMSERAPNLRKKSVYYLVSLSIFLCVTFLLGYVLWNVTIIWVTSRNPDERTLMGLIAINLIFFEVTIGLYLLSLMHWILKGLPIFDLRENLTLWVFPNRETIPLRKRIRTCIVILPLLAVIDTTFIIMIFVIVNVNNFSQAQYFDFVYTLSATFGKIVTIIGCIVLFFLQVSYLHWVLTGFPIRSFSDLFNWTLRSE